MREYPPEEMAAHEAAEPVAADASLRSDLLPAERFFGAAPMWVVAGAIVSILVYSLEFEKEMYLLGFGMIIFGLLLASAGGMARGERGLAGFVEVFSDLLQMPRTMKQLAWVQFFSWFGLFSMFLYTTAAVTSHVYGTNDPTSDLYNEGANWVGVLFGAYNGVAALVAFGLPWLARRTSRRATHMLALILGGLSLASFLVIRDPMMLMIPMVGIGIAWASILSMPYAILTDSLPAGKFGVYMGIFNFFIVLPQITAATVYGQLLEHVFAHQAVWVLVMGGASLVVAAFLMLRIDDEPVA